MSEFPIPSRIARAYDGRTSLTLEEAADALEMSPRELRREVKAGKIHYVLRGGSERRKLRRFLEVDLVGYLEAQRKQECPSTPARNPRSSGRNSKSTVYDFASLREKLTGERPRPQRRA